MQEKNDNIINSLNLQVSRSLKKYGTGKLIFSYLALFPQLGSGEECPGHQHLWLVLEISGYSVQGVWGNSGSGVRGKGRGNFGHLKYSAQIRLHTILYVQCNRLHSTTSYVEDQNNYQHKSYKNRRREILRYGGHCLFAFSPDAGRRCRSALAQPGPPFSAFRVMWYARAIFVPFA